MWQPLSGLISDSLKKSGIAKQVNDALICEEFNKIAAHILGEAAEHCRAVYIKDRCLWVAVLSSSASNELKLYEADVLKAVAERFGPGRVEAVRFLT